MKWSKEKLETAISILKKATSKDVALSLISKKFKEEISYDSLQNALRRNGFESPFFWLGRTGVSLHDVAEADELLVKFLKVIKKKKNPPTFREICDKLDVAPSTVDELILEAKNGGFQVDVTGECVSLDTSIPAQESVPMVMVKTEKENMIRLGVISDTHFGAKAALKEEVADFVNMAYEKYGIRTFLHCGDMLAGNTVYRGQAAELEAWGCDDQCDLLAKHLPEREGLRYIGILGNHDVDFIKSNGADPAKRIMHLRKDINVIGHIKAKLILKENGLQIELAHIKSAAHARSYSLEKHIYRTISKTNQPDIIFCGHRHINGYFEVQGIHSFLVPCFEDENIFTRYNDFRPCVGGLIVDIYLDDNKQIIRCDPKFFMYKAKPDDVVEVTL